MYIAHVNVYLTLYTTCTCIGSHLCNKPSCNEIANNSAHTYCMLCTCTLHVIKLKLSAQANNKIWFVTCDKELTKVLTRNWHLYIDVNIMQINWLISQMFPYRHSLSLAIKHTYLFPDEWDCRNVAVVDELLTLLALLLSIRRNVSLGRGIGSCAADWGVCGTQEISIRMLYNLAENWGRDRTLHNTHISHIGCIINLSVTYLT